jgi:hypothetical protein
MRCFVVAPGLKNSKSFTLGSQMVMKEYVRD